MAPFCQAKGTSISSAFCLSNRPFGGKIRVAATDEQPGDGIEQPQPLLPSNVAQGGRESAGSERQLVVGGAAYAGYERTEVDFVRMSTADIRWYVGTGEPMDKAGAYHIDGIGALFVSAIKGSPSNVEGLPVGLVRSLADRAGLPLGSRPALGRRRPR